jgi:hypothetical protein
MTLAPKVQAFFRRHRHHAPPPAKIRPEVCAGWCEARLKFPKFQRQLSKVMEHWDELSKKYLETDCVHEVFPDDEIWEYLTDTQRRCERLVIDALTAASVGLFGLGGDGRQKSGFGVTLGRAVSRCCCQENVIQEHEGARNSQIQRTMTTGKSFGSIWLNIGVSSRESLKETRGSSLTSGLLGTSANRGSGPSDRASPFTSQKGAGAALQCKAKSILAGPGVATTRAGRAPRV